MTRKELVRALVTAVMEWREHDYQDHTQVMEAADALAALDAQCKETAVAGNPSWPHILKCDQPAGHDGNHNDPVRGLWRPARDVPLLP